MTRRSGRAEERKSGRISQNARRHLSPVRLVSLCRFYPFIILLAAFLLLLLTVSNGVAQTNDPSATMILQKRLGMLERRVADLEREAAGLRSELESVQFPSSPETLTLCDKLIPLGREDVRERFEREFYLILENRGLLTILLKRYSKFLPSITEEINGFRLPPDLIYLAMAESYLNPRVVSTAGAGGVWQFMKETGKREGLFINDTVDERYSIPLSTYSALVYLRKLHAEFGDWFLAMAAYNCGEARVREAIANQNTRDFFDLFLPEETERYVMRIAAFKELVSNAGRYGLNPDRKDYYTPYSMCGVILSVAKDVHTASLAQATGLPYKAFRDCNLHLRRYTLSKGSYHIFMPLEKKEIFLRRVRSIPGVFVEKAG